MKRTALARLQDRWMDAVRSCLPAAKGNAAKATSLAARKFPRLRAELLAAANPGKRTRAVDEIPEDDEEIEDDTELEDDEDEEETEKAPAVKKKSKAKSRRR